MMNRIKSSLIGNMRLFCVSVMVLFSLLSFVNASSPAQNPLVLRVRLPDGSLQKLAIDPDSTDKVSLQDTLKLLPVSISQNNDDDDGALQIQTQTSIQAPSVDVADASQTLKDLGLQHGSLITLHRPKAQKQQSSSKDRTTSSSFKRKPATWNPFPELAKDYEATVRRLKLQKRNRGNYADLLERQAQLHLVEPQPLGYLKRIYMCRTSAERFRNACVNSNKASTSSQPSSSSSSLSVGLLLGTISKERVDPQSRKRARTSLSSTTEREEFCQAAKVQALVAFPATTNAATSDNYDASRLLSLRNDNKEIDKAAAASNILRVAEWLGLRPVGWIFLYNDHRLDEADTLPVLGCDVAVAAQLQVQEMKAAKREESSKGFCTLAMDVNSGATDAFQLSDVSVQMQAEGLFDTPQFLQKNRLAHTRHPVLVDGQEVKEFDAVLCLVNTALLSHEGRFAGTNSVKKNGMLTKKTKKALLQALDEKNDAALLGALSDFNLLLVFDEWLGPSDSETLCRAVQLYSRGQKKSVSLDQKLKDRIRSILETH